MKWWPNRQKQRTAQQAQRASHDEPTHQEATKMRGIGHSRAMIAPPQTICGHTLPLPLIQSINYYVHLPSWSHLFAASDRTELPVASAYTKVIPT